MNWGLVGWVAGTMLTVYAIKFVIMLMRNTFSKQNANRVIAGIEDRANQASEWCVDKFNQGMERRRKKPNEEDERPTITIR